MNDLVQPGLVAGAVGLALGAFKLVERAWDKHNGNGRNETTFHVKELRRETKEQTAILREISQKLN